ncbi:hypothetical protein BofuT4_P093020.1 [Botrytis cinerea T4]|uniref:Uncharacterized protein n=1 Tax=Botryotinia fuckeliana (strain T4) TaxID=999810 RepID=G2YE32_BOTF4|nr:hypothetical protein BofuT4_P093020.1 [Botrytis cinerea T4]
MYTNQSKTILKASDLLNNCQPSLYLRRRHRSDTYSSLQVLLNQSVDHHINDCAR